MQIKRKLMLLSLLSASLLLSGCILSMSEMCEIAGDEFFYFCYY